MTHSEGSCDSHLKDESCVDVLLGAGYDPHTASPGVEVAGPGYDGDGGPHGLSGMDHTHFEGIHCRSPTDTGGDSS